MNQINKHPDYDETTAGRPDSQEEPAADSPPEIDSVSPDEATVGETRDSGLPPENGQKFEKNDDDKDAGSMSGKTTTEVSSDLEAGDSAEPNSSSKTEVEETEHDTNGDGDTSTYPEEIIAQLDLSEEAERIAQQLQEPMTWMIQNAIDLVGLDQVEELVQETEAIEAAGGMWTAGRERRRTPGGIFFKLLKDKTDRATAKQIFEPPAPIREYLDLTRPKGPAHPPPLTPLPWSKVRTLVNKLLEQPLEKCIVRITLMGRPSQVSKTKSCVVVALKGQRPPSLPKGLPPVPEDSEYSFAVFIAHKHWSRVAPVMAQDANAKLIIEGYPVFDAKRGVTIVLAQHTRVTSSGFRHRQAVSFR